MHLGGSPLLVEQRWTVYRCNALSVILGDSCIVEVVCCFDDVKRSYITTMVIKLGWYASGFSLCALFCFVLCRTNEMIWILKDKGRKCRLLSWQCQ